MTSAAIKKFQKTIWDYYNQNKRDFPWRQTKNPYYILISEVMLQQTQTARVVTKYLEFLENFPEVKDFANATISDVLKLWSGLGYNRRGKFLWETAKKIHTEYNDIVPDSPTELEKLPGIGPYTARAISTFAFDQSNAFLETNIRTVMIHFFLADREKVTDKEILALVQLTLPEKDFRNWFYALMDYGVYLKSQKISHLDRQKHYRKQSKFKGSKRFVRGYILKYLTKNESMDIKTMEFPGYEPETVTEIVDQLIKEDLIVSKNGLLYLP